MIEVVGVASSRADARALERAAALDIPGAVFDIAEHPDRESRDAAMAAWLEERGRVADRLCGLHVAAHARRSARGSRVT